MRRVLSLVVAVVLVPLVWSCESEQTGYDVKIPLIGPMEFDETSCEGSGDLCSVDADCIDEDGFNDGPCTKTMEVLEPITVAVSMSPASPSYTLPTLDTSRWIAPFAVQQSGRGFPVDMTMDNFSLQDGPVDISVRIFSRIGRISGQDLGYQPMAPSSCAFTLNDGATGEDYAGAIHTCLRDWIDENGAPLDFDMEVTSSAGAAPAGTATKSGFGLKQEGYLVEGQWTQLTSEDECESDSTDDVLEAIEEGKDFFGLLSCKDLRFEGSGTTDQEITISGGSDVWDRCGNYLGTGLLLKTSLGPGTYTVTVYPKDGVVEVEQDVPAIFVPAPDVFVEALLSAAAGRCESGTPVGESGYAVAWWDHCGPKPPPTRTGSIGFAAKGFCEVDQGSGAAGGSGGQ
jgi:hypothetical protein